MDNQTDGEHLVQLEQELHQEEFLKVKKWPGRLGRDNLMIKNKKLLM
jgi:hypothetical protein